MTTRRREFLSQTSTLSALSVLAACSKGGGSSAAARAIRTTPPGKPLTPPAGAIPVAFVLSEGAQVIDFCGPWEVFQDVRIPARGDVPVFTLYTVAEALAPIRASGGMTIVPSYTFATAPPPKVIVVAAQSSRTEPLLSWLRDQSKTTDVTMSVCTGAFVLAAAGLLSGRAATTYHGALGELAAANPDVKIERGMRFVEDGNVASSGGLSAGIDLALRVVERYFGRDVAAATAYMLEYQGEGWRDPASNVAWKTVRSATPGMAACPVCGMDVDPKIALHETYGGADYYFCSDHDRASFDAAPQQYT